MRSPASAPACSSLRRRKNEISMARSRGTMRWSALCVTIFTSRPDPALGTPRTYTCARAMTQHRQLSLVAGARIISHSATAKSQEPVGVVGGNWTTINVSMWSPSFLGADERRASYTSTSLGRSRSCWFFLSRPRPEIGLLCHVEPSSFHTFAFDFNGVGGRALTLQRPLVPAPKVGVLQSLGQSRRSPVLVDAPAADPPPAFGWAARKGGLENAEDHANRPAVDGARGRQAARQLLHPALHANNCHAPKPVAEHANLWANLRFPIGVPLELLKQEARPHPKHIPFPGDFPRERDRIPLDAVRAGDPNTNTPRQLTPEARFQDLRSVSGFWLRPAHADRPRPTDQKVPRPNEGRPHSPQRSLDNVNLDAESAPA